jgi:carbamoyl-phosphate synthase large subunit
MNNFLITSIGSFSGKEVITSLKQQNNFVVGIDINNSENIFESTLPDVFYVSPLVSAHVEFKEFIQQIIKKHNIDYVIPLTDLDVDFFSCVEFSSTCVCISYRQGIEVCRDKLLFYLHFQNSQKINLIPTLEYDGNKKIDFPAVLKPRKGRSSQGLIKANTEFDYNPKNPSLSKYIVQPLLSGEIVTCDTIRDPVNEIIYTFSRIEKIRTTNGAGISVYSFSDPCLDLICSEIMKELNLIGAVCIEFIKSGKKYYLMDINPRFSAGISFTSKIGYDLVKNHVRCFKK